jgi:signal transduction histidine kinase
VKDAGTGIPEEYHTSIFKIFERGVATPGSMGTGVGLAIVKRALERAGGRITLISKEGEGSDFIVTLPCESGAVPAGNGRK